MLNLHEKYRLIHYLFICVCVQVTLTKNINGREKKNDWIISVIDRHAWSTKCAEIAHIMVALG